MNLGTSLHFLILPVLWMKHFISSIMAYQLYLEIISLYDTQKCIISSTQQYFIVIDELFCPWHLFHNILLALLPLHAFVIFSSHSDLFAHSPPYKLWSSLMYLMWSFHLYESFPFPDDDQCNTFFIIFLSQFIQYAIPSQHSCFLM